MDKTRNKTILFMVLATLCNSTAQLVYKHSVNSVGLDVGELLFHSAIILGLISYGISGVLLLLALKEGEASVLYPIYTLSFIWIGLGSWWFFDEHIGLSAIIGMLAIIIGIIFINTIRKPQTARVKK